VNRSPNLVRTNHTVPYGTDLHIAAFQAFHARLPSLNPPQDNLRYSLRDNSLTSVRKTDSTPRSHLENEDDDEYEDEVSVSLYRYWRLNTGVRIVTKELDIFVGEFFQGCGDAAKLE
jgi:hypothetical protein